MIGLTISFIGGIAAFHFFPFFPVSIILVCIAAIVLLFLIQPNLSFPRSGGFADEKVKLNRLDSGGRSVDFWKKISSIVLIFVSGFIYSYVRQETVPEIRLPDRDVFIEGTVIDVPESSEGKIRFTIDDVNIEGEDIHGRARLFILLERFFEKGTINYFVFNPGDRISAVARLWEPSVFHNPGVYSYDLKKDGIVATGYIKQMRITGRGRGVLEWMHKERQRLGRIIDNSLSSDNASLHKAILPGLKRGISRDMRDSFSSTGLAHLLSISGTHFGLLAFIIFKFIKTVIKFLPMRFLTRMTLYITPAQVAVILTLPVLILYALISGTSTPTIRSFIMIFIFMLALFLGRKGQWLNSLSIAAIIILLWRPDTLFELSFILSFIAVLSIGYVLEKKTELENLNKELELEYITKTAEPSGAGYKLICRNFMQKSFDRIKTGLIITIAAVLGTAPIVAIYFKQFPLISPITNLIVTPLVCFIV
ncbi:MAG: ComEC family competence protein, partial [Candidatus Mariimomonas ferrooxydans]